jgi:hypothetical protein
MELFHMQEKIDFELLTFFLLYFFIPIKGKIWLIY